MTVKVLEPGLATTVQDLGRPGYFHLGIPLSGAMDRLALRTANMLVGNDEAAAALEAVFVGPKLEFLKETTVAVTGADMPAILDGNTQKAWTSFKVQAGQQLSFDFLQRGARIYIAFAGGINVPLALGSRSTYTIGALGGYEGRALQPDDILQLGTAKKTVEKMCSVTENLRPMPEAQTEIRVLPGLYWDRLTPASADSFFDDLWKVSPEADRMGYRFCGGKPLSLVQRKQPFGAGSDQSNVVDCCYPYGSVQVPGGTEPIVLHRDAVSGGGYFMLGAVISADMDSIGQLQPHMAVRFTKVTMEAALKARAERAGMLDKIRHACT